MAQSNLRFPERGSGRARRLLTPLPRVDKGNRFTQNHKLPMSLLFFLESNFFYYYLSDLTFSDFASSKYVSFNMKEELHLLYLQSLLHFQQLQFPISSPLLLASNIDPHSN